MRPLFILLLSGTTGLALMAQPSFEKAYLRPDAEHISPSDKDHPQYNPHMEKYDVHFYKLNLEADNQSAYLKGSTTIGARTVAALDTFVVELMPQYGIDSVLVNGIRSGFTRDYDDILIAIEPVLSENTKFEVQIFYEGIVNEVSGQNGYMHNPEYSISYTLSEPFYARWWFPCAGVVGQGRLGFYFYNHR